MIRVSIDEAEADFDQLIDQVESKGEIVYICRNGKPVVQLSRGLEDNGLEDSVLSPDTKD